jgi:hypothetical protein
MHYDRMMEDALRGVVRQSIASAARQGLLGEHHFYITFRTDTPGVVMPDHLRQKHPEEMTIVLQHQFWGLEVDERAFSVSLSFNQQQERLTVPLSAITAFVDPAVQFGLQFPGGLAGEGGKSSAAAGLAAAGSPAVSGPRSPLAGEGRVIALDAFRKK